LLARAYKAYRLLPPLFVREVKERFAGSAFGLAWAILQPLFQILMFWFIFSQVMRIRIKADTGEVPFIAFLLSALLPWFALSEGALKGASSIVEKGYLIKKVFYPTELFPISAVLTAFFFHGIGFVLFLAGYALHTGGPQPACLAGLALIMVLQFFFTAGLALFFSSMAVYVRDILQILGIVLQVLAYTTTIFFPLNSIPAAMRPFISLNPLTPLIEGYHSIVIYQRLPGAEQFLFVGVLSLTVFSLGAFFFRKLKRGFADVL
jgi:homopolymeric O-antigen transport system permease protein